VISKPALEIAEGDHAVTVRDELRYVGRGGLKLEAALDAFGIDVMGMRGLDVGASTGGFTDCLLQRGAASVFAVDSGSGQLASKLLGDPRVRSMEKMNARELTLQHLDGVGVDIVVMDVSFISATYLLPLFPSWMQPCGHAVCLIKPQFEVGRAMIGKGGIVKDPKAHRFAVDRVLESGRQAGFLSKGVIPSPIRGGDGNQEFLVHFTLEK
jgi:23S rRNA (cytidine1920-2'-O)/16S rRNA (cytidine1409-2'-O)-methyltransferase